jgi:hypothetical protein
MCPTSMDYDQGCHAAQHYEVMPSRWFAPGTIDETQRRVSQRLETRLGVLADTLHHLRLQNQERYLKVRSRAARRMLDCTT